VKRIRSNHRHALQLRHHPSQQDKVDATTMAAGPATEGLLAAVTEWTKFLAHAKRCRLDPDRFAKHVRILYSKRPLPPILLADLLLSPSSLDADSLDPRVLQYLWAVLKQGRIGTAVVLRAVYKYSSAHTRVQPPHVALAGDKEKDGAPKRQIVRWKNSYSSEETILWRLAQGVNQGTAIRTASDVVAVAKVLAKWMGLLTEAAAAFSRDAFGSMAGLQAKDETEDARNAFILFFFAFSENPVVLSTLSRPACKGRKRLFWS
jgi:mediator of RNA polymerase II transcription subunit 5